MPDLGTRDGREPIDGIVKPAGKITRSTFSALNDSSPQTVQFAAPKSGKITRIRVFKDNVGAGSTSFLIQLWDKSPANGTLGVNDVWSATITGMTDTTAENMIDRVCNPPVPYENRDADETEQQALIYMKITATGTSTADYAGYVEVTTEEFQVD